MLALFLLLQQAASPVASIQVRPGLILTMAAGDTLVLSAVALDAAGRPVPNARIRFGGVGARFEGEVDSMGVVRSGSTGTLPFVAIASVPGSRPVVQAGEIKMVAGPATRVVITPAVTRLIVGQRLVFQATGYTKLGDPRTDSVSWSSTAPAVARIRRDGLVTALRPGRARISARIGKAETGVTIEVGTNTIATVAVEPGLVEARQGDVVRFRLVARDGNGREVAGLAPLWTFAPGQGLIDPDGGFVGYEAGRYTVTAHLGDRTAEATVTLGHRDARRPATVLGRLPRTQFHTEELWLHPNGTHAYLGTGRGGDRLYAIDIADPAKPFITDSLVVNTRRVNDIMSTPDGKFLVFTREGASDRKNGIVIASIEDPAHPKVIAEYTEGVTAGVHSAFVARQEKFGTHVYLTNDGTGALHILDLSDPYHPRETARWRTAYRPDAGRSLHDIDVQDGLLYASYWNDGLVILDVGNGIKGGSPSNPQLVSQFKYDLNALYRDVEAAGGPGFIRGTHTAWRHKNYVFIADEVFPAEPPKGAKNAAADRAYGRLQVIDVSDLANPRSVAWYEPEYGGVHNVWVAGDTLYMGAYDAGFRAFDVSGELRGDLRAQQREIVHVNTGDLDGIQPNEARAWGVIVRNGLAYVNDNHSGLWIIRIEPRRRELVP
ncbi:MAG: Ig-like domain-containing protein [Gemmatimonadales bacterium]